MAGEQTASASASTNAKLTAVEDVEIDGGGRFKYILIKVHDLDDDEDSKYIVRGTVKAPYHGKS